MIPTLTMFLLKSNRVRFTSEHPILFMHLKSFNVSYISLKIKVFIVNSVNNMRTDFNKELLDVIDF